jgi:hypothetical protein
MVSLPDVDWYFLCSLLFHFLCHGTILCVTVFFCVLVLFIVIVLCSCYVCTALYLIVYTAL